MITRNLVSLAAGALVLATASLPSRADAQDGAPRRTRVALGPQLVPSYPGSDGVSIRPLIDVARAPVGEPYDFEAADESFGFSVFESGGFAAGPSLGFEGSRTAKDVGAPVRKIGTTFELGGFVQYTFVPAFRARVEVRKGLGGHRGLIAITGVDYVMRDADKWLFSLGPRVTLANDRYQRAYFSVTPEDSLASGLPVYRAKGGVQAVGATAGFIRELTPRWGIYTYAKYDRLVSDAADSPIVRGFGSRNQLSGGVALTYTFGSVAG